MFELFPAPLLFTSKDLDPCDGSGSTARIRTNCEWMAALPISGFDGQPPGAACLFACVFFLSSSLSPATLWYSAVWGIFVDELSRSTDLPRDRT